jgi:phosphoribosylformylglycinamidine synthase
LKAKVYVTLKDGIHDPQGKAVTDALSTLGFDGVEQVRVGKYFEMDITADSLAAAEQLINGMCDQLLANTVIEKYRYELEK